MKAEEKTVAFMFFSVVMQFVYLLGKKNRNKKKKKKKKKKKRQNFGVGDRGGKGQEQRDRRAKFYWRTTGNSNKNIRRGPDII